MEEFLPTTTVTVTVDGVSYTVIRTAQGSTVNSLCDCFGSRFRTHSTSFCPWRVKRLMHELDAMMAL